MLRGYICPDKLPNKRPPPATEVDEIVTVLCCHGDGRRVKVALMRVVM